MQKFLGAILVIILFAACKKERPPGIIDQQKMTGLLFDMHLADAYTMTGTDSVRQKTALFYTSIYSKYGIDSAGFKQNMEYYAAHPAQLQDIYAEISKRYRSMEAVFIAKQEKENRQRFVADSLKQIRYADSLKRLKADSAAYARQQYQLYWKHADSTHLRPPAWDVDSAMLFWKERFYVKPNPPSAPPAESDTPLIPESN